jgi:hypothetical protein
MGLAGEAVYETVPGPDKCPEMGASGAAEHLSLGKCIRASCGDVVADDVVVQYDCPVAEPELCGGVYDEIVLPQPAGVERNVMVGNVTVG